MNKRVILKKGKDKPLRQRHHWIFSGAVQSLPSDLSPGEILPVYSHEGHQLGSAYFNPRCSLIGRILSFGEEDPLLAIERNLLSALNMRQAWFSPSITNAYRLINGEGDGLPGLVIDKYADCLVVQIATLGMDQLKQHIVSLLRKHIPKCSTIYEKSRLPTRREEGLKDVEGLLWGRECEEIEVVENGIKELVSLSDSQKTGLFLDQREMRQLIGHLSRGKRLLNCFAYSGGFSLYACRGGAVRTDSVDISEKAIALAKTNFALNNFTLEQNGFYTEDVFQFLRERPLDYDIVILDPPAFAKKKNDIVAACRGYKDLNRIAMQKMPKQSLLLTCSCSYHVDEQLFQTVVFQAALESGRQVRIIDRHHQAADHPINIYHPEGQYLKSLLLYLD